MMATTGTQLRAQRLKNPYKPASHFGFWETTDASGRERPDASGLRLAVADQATAFRPAVEPVGDKPDTVADDIATRAPKLVVAR